jgi:hypothetical protein
MIAPRIWDSRQRKRAGGSILLASLILTGILPLRAQAEPSLGHLALSRTAQALELQQHANACERFSLSAEKIGSTSWAKSV